MKMQNGKKRAVFGLFTALTVCFSGVLQAAPEKKWTPQEAFEFEIPADAFMKEIKKRRSILENNIFQLVRTGDRFFQRFRYEDAFKTYEEALKAIEDQDLGNGTYIQNVKAKIRKRSVTAHTQWANDVFLKARRAYNEALTKGASSEAIESFRGAEKIALDAYRIYYFKNPDAVEFDSRKMKDHAQKDPSFYNRIEAFRKDCQNMVSTVEFQLETSLENIDPGRTSRKKEIAAKLEQARVYYRQQRYERARNAAEQILVLDPYNEPAIVMLQKIYQRLYKIAVFRRESDALDKMSDVSWRWVEPIQQEEGKVIISSDTPKGVEGSSNSLIGRKLEKIIIDSVDFQQQTVGQILAELTAISKEKDKEYTKEKGRGVDFHPTNDVRERVINSLALENVSLLVALKYLCKLAGDNVKYRIDEDGVKVGGTENNYETRSIPISKIYARRIQAELGDGPVKEEKEERDRDDEMEDLSDKKDKSKEKKGVSLRLDPAKLQTYFQERGVPFPEGAKISYEVESGQLIVENSPSNIAKLERVVQELDIAAPMVLVEAKILEITMNAMEELGFDWNLTMDNTNAHKSFIYSSALPIGKIYSTSSSNSANVLVNNLNLLPNVGGSRNINLFLTVRALDQSDRSEIITMPRLIALSGQQATLSVDEERSFPQDYDDPEVEISSNGNTYTYTPPVPDFETQTVGASFSIKPTVINHQIITLDLDVELSKFIGWSNYDYTIKIGKQFESIAETSSANLSPKMKMAEFAERRIKTQVDIWDGETVVIGGVLQDEVSRLDDKYPLLGDLPLIGRLFTDRSYHSGKINLMVFVTSRIMDRDGLPYNKDKRQERKDGLFHFINR